MLALVYPFLVLSAIGFAVMLVVHVAALFGVTAPFANGLRYLGPGVFVLAVPMILVMNRLTRDSKQKDTWRAALRGCPQMDASCSLGHCWIRMGRICRVALPVRRWHGIGDE